MGVIELLVFGLEIDSIGPDAIPIGPATSPIGAAQIPIGWDVSPDWTSFEAGFIRNQASATERPPPPCAAMHRSQLPAHSRRPQA